MRKFSIPECDCGRSRFNGELEIDDYRELVIADLADENAVLREVNGSLVDLIADVTLENVRLRVLYDCEFLSRFHGDIVIARLRRQLHRRAA